MGNTPLATAGCMVAVLALTERSGRQWQHKLDDLLLSIGLILSNSDANKAPLAMKFQQVVFVHLN